MEYALDYFTKESVYAESRQAQLTQCICPGCYEEVTFAGGSGTYQRAHFRHLAHLGPETCEYRVSPGYEANPLNPAIWFHRPRTLELFLELRDDSWDLELLVPRYDGDYRFSLGSCSLGGFTYDSDEVPIGGKTFPVFPQPEPYEVEIRTRRGPWRKALIQGLEAISLFNIGGGRGRKQHKNQVLQWGQIVAMLSQEPIEERKAPKKLHVKRLKPKNGWHAYLIALPVTTDVGVADWVRTVLGKRMGPASEYVVGLVRPIGVRRADDGTWLVTQPEVTLAVKSEDKARTVVSVSCTKEGENRGQQFSFSLADGLAVFPVTLPGGCSRISVGTASLQIEVVKTLVDIPAPRVSLVFHVDGKRVQVPIFSHELYRHLEQVRIGKSSLRDCYLPGICEVTATFANAGKSERAALIGAETSPDNAVSVRFAEQLEEWIKKGRGTVTVDAGGFGQFVFPASPSAAETPPKTDWLIDHKRLWLNAARKLEGSARTRFIVHQRALARATA
jgi:hypothetical protein